MVVKYGNIILLMETLINSTCYKVSTDVLYRLGFLSHTDLPVYTSDPNKCTGMWRRIAGGARPGECGMGHSHLPESYGSRSPPGWKQHVPGGKQTV